MIRKIRSDRFQDATRRPPSTRSSVTSFRSGHYSWQGIRSYHQSSEPRHNREPQALPVQAPRRRLNRRILSSVGGIG